MNQVDLFPIVNKRGARFSDDLKHRYLLWRIWDHSKPLVMFIGLNPSTADGEKDDKTIESVRRISEYNGYGGFYMMNCWSYIATEPKDLIINPSSEKWNLDTITVVAAMCNDVVFAWGDFKVVRDHGKHDKLTEMFPRAKCITRNKNGSPGHPLYKKRTSVLIDFAPEKGEAGVKQ